MFTTARITSWDAWGLHGGDRSHPDYQRGVRQLKAWHERCRQREMIGKPGYCKDCGKKLYSTNTTGWCCICRANHETEIKQNRRQRISQTKKERKMKNKYMVYTDHGDYAIWAKNAEDAADIVSKLNYCRVKVTAVERCF